LSAEEKHVLGLIRRSQCLRLSCYFDVWRAHFARAKSLFYTAPMHTVFICYSSADKTVALDACKELERVGIKCWVAQRDMMAGQHYNSQITEAIRRAKAFILVLSRNSDRSIDVLREVELAAHIRLPLLAFRIEDFEPGYDLGRVLSAEHWLNAYEGASPEAHFSALLLCVSALVRRGDSASGEAVVESRSHVGATETVKFANYHILKLADGTLFRLGSGAMGVTYKAFDRALDRNVALKVIAASLLANEDARRRFLREARAAAKIQHPHVAAIYHLGQEGEDYFYTMEFVDGEDLERYVQVHGPLSPEVALRVVLQVAEALEAAQVYKLIHRDIKPANIMARAHRAGELDIKLVDFGLAKRTGPDSQEFADITLTASFLGSPAYASPEQCNLGELDIRSDIYSLGATLWYLLTGKPPFGGGVNQVLIAHVAKSPPFDRLQGIPEPVIGLVRRMMAKSPDDRPQDPEALQEALESILAGDIWGAADPTSTGSNRSAIGGLENAGPEETALVSASLDVYRRVKAGVLIATRYRLLEEQPEGNGGRLFLAHDENGERTSAVQVALKLIRPGIDLYSLDLVRDEIKRINGVVHPNVVAYYGLEKGASGSFIVREWVHGFSLYELLRLRRSLKPEEVIALLGPLPRLLDSVSEHGLGLVDVSIRKIFVSCPIEVQPDEFPNLAKGDARAWAICSLKLNTLSLAPLLFRERSDWSNQTLLPSVRDLSITQAEVGIRETKSVSFLGSLVYELIRGQAPSSLAGERPSPLPLLTEAGNQALRRALGVTAGITPFRDCEEFWKALKDSASDRINRLSSTKATTSESSDKTRERGINDYSKDGKRTPNLAPIFVAALGLVICAAAGLAIYFNFLHPEHKRAAFASNPHLPSIASTPVAGMRRSPTPSVSEWMFEAQRYLAIMDFANALPLLQKGADAGDPIAMESLGVLYRAGKGVAQDYTQAREWFEKAAEEGNPAALTNLGELYGNGYGVPRQYAKAFECSREGAEAGNVIGMTNFGLLLKNPPKGSEDDEKAHQWFQKAADIGDPVAMSNLGLLYEQGEGVGRDYTKARECYQKVANAGDAIAMTLLGSLYENGKGIGRDDAKAREWYQKAADAGYANAANDVGLLYEHGNGVSRDDAKAREWYQKAADGGYVIAMINLALLYEEGKGGARDEVKAQEWYQKAAEAGRTIATADFGLRYDGGESIRPHNDDAWHWFRKTNGAREMINVAWLYEQGKGVAKDYGKALEWFHKAADTGDAIATGDLGALYQNGEVVPQDYRKARELFEKAAGGGDARSMTELGILYETGEGGAQDEVKAREWYQKAADVGSVVAMTNLAVMLYYGTGGPQNVDKALEWFQNAANAGNTKAMVSLGMMYKEGRYISQDYGKAREWFQKAADAGEADAKQALSDLPNAPAK
jgi:TPR repeat protein/serine/threonine protein kinase